MHMKDHFQLIKRILPIMIKNIKIIMKSISVIKIIEMIAFTLKIRKLLSILQKEFLEILNLCIMKAVLIF